MRTILPPAIVIYLMCGNAYGQVQPDRPDDAITLPGPCHISVAFSKDGKHLLLAGEESCQVWDTATWKRARPRIEYGDFTFTARLSDDGSRVLAVRSVVHRIVFPQCIQFKYVDYESRVWDVNSGKPLGPPIRHEIPGDNIYCSSHACLSPDGRLVATAGDGKMIRVWRAETGDLHSIFGDDEYLEDFRFSDDGSTFITLSSHGSMSTWDVRTGRIRSNARRPFHVAWSITDDRIVSDTIGRCEVFEIHTGKRLFASKFYNKYDLDEMKLSPDGSHVAISVKFEATDFFEVAGGKALESAPAAGMVAFDPQGSAALIIAGDEASGVWDYSQGRWTRKLPAHTHWLCGTFSPDGRLLAAGGCRAACIIAASPGIEGPSRWQATR